MKKEAFCICFSPPALLFVFGESNTTQLGNYMENQQNVISNRHDTKEHELVGQFKNNIYQ